MTSLFKRQAELQVGDTLLTGLDISFCIEKTLAREPNTAEFKIWNLNDRNRKYLRDQVRVPVTLKAGYENAMGLLFRGDLSEAFSEREGPDWVTTIRSGDGLESLQSSRINKSFKAGTPIIDILKEISTSLGINVGDAIAFLEKRGFSSNNKKLLNGAVLSGSASNELDKWLKSVGLEGSVQDGALQVLVSGQALERTAVLLSSETGLIGSPEVSSKGILRARSLLNPDLFPGRKIKVESKEIKEPQFRIARVIFSGETFGQDWYVDIEAESL
jgi:hypothetical protein